MGRPGFEHGYAFPRGLSVGIISRYDRGGSRRNAISWSLQSDRLLIRRQV
jgi:hypothetical protein